MDTNICIRDTGKYGALCSHAECVVPGRVVVCGQATPGSHPATDYGEAVASQAPHHVNATGLQKRQKWSTDDNRKVMECYYNSRPTQIGYRQRMHKIWIDSGYRQVTEQRLADQANQIRKKGWCGSRRLNWKKLNDGHHLQPRVNTRIPKMLQMSFTTKSK